MNKKVLKYLGIVSLMIGIFFILGNTGITGNVVINEINKTSSGILGLIFIVVGILLMAASKRLELRVFEIETGDRQFKPGKDNLYMTDPELFFSETGQVSLSDLREKVGEISNDPELIGMVRSEYCPELHRIAESEDPESEIAQKFYDVIAGSAPSRETMTKEERDKIYNAFKKGWGGHPNIEQNRILREYNFEFVAKEGHNEIRYRQNPGIKVTTSCSPSDPNAGKNVGRDVIRMIKEIRKSD